MLKRGADALIDRKLRRDDLIGKKCRALRGLRNRGGQGISKDAVCTIKDVIRGSGFIVETEKCPHCGQYAYITHVSRDYLELISYNNRRCGAAVSRPSG